MTTMECLYINLDSAVARRESLEASFLLSARPGWTLNRWPATTAAQVEADNIEGRLPPAHKACFLSHKALVTDHAARPGHLMVLEDDAQFGFRTCTLVDQILSNNPELKWDVLWTDIAVTDPAGLLRFAKLRRELSARGDALIIDLAQVSYAGATAYIIREGAKARVAEMLAENGAIDIPYDLRLRQLVYEGRLSGHVVFPYLTTISQHAFQSNIHVNTENCNELIWNAFRRLSWWERDLDAEQAMIFEIMPQLCDLEASLYGLLLGATTTEAFRST